MSKNLLLSLSKADAMSLKTYLRLVLGSEPPTNINVVSAIVHLLDAVAEEERRQEAINAKDNT